MRDLTITFRVTVDEYSSIEKEADKNGMTVPQYAKSKLVDSDYSKAVDKLITRTKEFSSGEKFNIKKMFTEDEWEKLPRGVKLTLGKQFYKMVEKDKIADVEIGEKDSANTMWYRKK